MYNEHSRTVTSRRRWWDGSSTMCTTCSRVVASTAEIPPPGLGLEEDPCGIFHHEFGSDAREAKPSQTSLTCTDDEESESCKFSFDYTDLDWD